jgi:hypothetical protein
MEIFGYVLVIALSTACGTLAYLLMDRPRRVAATPSTASGADLSLAERVNALEREFPAWRIAMEQLADAAGEMLDQAETKRRRARVSQTNAEAALRAAGGSEGEAEEHLGNQLQLVPGGGPLDPSQHRAAILRTVRARRGTR